MRKHEKHLSLSPSDAWKCESVDHPPCQEDRKEGRSRGDPGIRWKP